MLIDKYKQFKKLFFWQKKEKILPVKSVNCNNKSVLKVLFLAPQPFYQERGSPIANKMVLQVLSTSGYYKVDVVTYNEGVDLNYENVKLYRIGKLPFIKEIKPGFSGKKLVCDFLMFLKIIPLVLNNKYDLVHAVEESVFIALFLKCWLKIPYLYDMDSSLPEQIIDKFPWLSRFHFCFTWFEKIAVENAQVIVPVCQEIANSISRYNSRQIKLIPDVSLLKTKNNKSSENLRELLNIDGVMLVYVGNLETYQGISLLLKSMVFVLQQTNTADLVIIGGDFDDIITYRQQARELGIDNRVHFIGPRSTNFIADYLQQADILVSPRINGKNTPMKLYSYLDSGKAVVATDLPTHTQVIDDTVAVLAKPNPKSFANSLLYLIENPQLRSRLGIAGKRLIQQKYTPAVFQQKFNYLYKNLKDQLLVPTNINSRND